MNSWNAAAVAGLLSVAVGMTAVACSSSTTGGSGGSDDAGATHASSSGGSSESCSELQTCCTTGTFMAIEASLKTQCMTTAAGGVATECAAILSTLQMETICSASGSSGSGSSASTGTGGCGSLSTCCGELPTAEQAGCKTIVTSEPSECATAYSGYQAAGLCK